MNKSNQNNRKPRSRAKPAASVPPFLYKIYEILENPNHQDLVSWNQDGNAFIIKNVTEFTENVLPKYFKHNNFASFVRQLNLYDFHKSRYENNGNEFHHKLFKRGEQHLLSEIKRKTPNEGTTSETTSPFLGQFEENTDSLPLSVFESSSSSVQDLIARQEKLESAMNIVLTQNKQLLKDNKMLWNEVTNLKNKQVESEKVTRTLNGQNTHLSNKNSYLWNEMAMKQERYERKMEKLMIFLISILQGQNPMNLFQKNHAGQRKSNAEEENCFENKANDGMNYSVLPVKQIIKHFTKKHSKPQLDQLLERLDDEGLPNLFGNKPLTIDEKDCLFKLSSMLEIEPGNKNFPSIEFLTDKRARQINQSFEDENPREGSSKFCKLEYDATQDSVLQKRTEGNQMSDILPQLPNHSFSDKFFKDDAGLNSPIQIENEFENLSFNNNNNIFNFKEYDIQGFEKPILPIRNNSLFSNCFSENEDNGEDEGMREHRSLKKSHSINRLEFLNQGDLKLDEEFRSLSPSAFLGNNHFKPNEHEYSF